MANFGGKPFYRGGDDGERGEIHGMPIARDDLRRDWLDHESHCLRNMFLDPRIDLREGADRPGNGAGCDLRARGDEPLLGAKELGVGVGEL